MENEQEASDSKKDHIRLPKGDTKDKNRQCLYDRLLDGTYKKDEIIVILPELRSPKEDEIKIIKDFHRQFGYLPEEISVRKCDDCNIPVFLLKAKNIHTVINTEGVVSGSGGTTSTVGETYSLNFYNNTPFDVERPFSMQIEKPIERNKKKPVIVAVLDTGFSKKLVDESYLWNGDSKNDSPCYKNQVKGWNFIEDNEKFDDDNAFRHGSVVSQYIINGFKHSTNNQVQIMPLKTHDKDGIGDLFGIICAIHFAIAKGANIINASWGFYYYDDFPLPYLKKLITETLKEKKILFVTAAGNQVKDEDLKARRFFLMNHELPPTEEELRNLEFHYFFPARLSLQQSNVITVTTTNEKVASWTQNHSDLYADLAVLADDVDFKNKLMSFYVPFNKSKELIRGSSFATAIATGIIGACCDLDTIRRVDKSEIIKRLMAAKAPVGTEKIASVNTDLATSYIKNGALTKNWGKI